MIIWLGRGDMVSCFFREDLGEVGVFQWERDLGFHLFGSDSEFHCHSEFDNEQGV